MGQYWMLVNIDKPQIGMHVGKLGEGEFDDSERVACQLITPLLKTVIPQWWLPKGAMRDKRSLGALNLPDELLRAIFEQVDALGDVVVLGVTDPRLALHAYERIQNERRAHKGQWAGDRIAVVGDSANGFPAHMLTPEEMEEFTASGLENLYELAYTTWFSLPGEYDRQLKAKMDGHLQKMYQDSRRISRSEIREADDMMYWSSCYDDNHPDGPYALCNLSNRQFIRLDAIAELVGKEMDGPYLDGKWGIGNVVGILALWMTDEDFVDCGPWGGDRLMITPIERMKTIDGEQDWHDFSEEGVRIVSRYLESVYGEDWSEYL